MIVRVSNLLPFLGNNMAVQLLAGYWDLDLDTRELLLCPRSRRMFGLAGDKPKRLSGYDWKPRIHPDDMPTIEDELDVARRHNKVYSARFRTLRPDGSSCEIIGMGRATVQNRKRFVGLNLDLNEAASSAERESRSIRRSMITLASGMLRAGPANENDSRPWRAWSVRAAASRFNRAEKDSERQRLLRKVQSAFELRQLRKSFLNPKMLGEPGFDILLALYVAPPSTMTSVRTISSLIDVSSSVAVRWLNFLVNEGLVLTMESASADEAGAIAAVLTDKGRITLNEYFKAGGSL
jgi:DNA-binding MarR family transcriptional regulator